ncbi:hypothetical protein DIPPA_26856 [Diplonema papillatum]|nr:hypothetical protein DIPPA_26856 [Diplonema papillatum]
MRSGTPASHRTNSTSSLPVLETSATRKYRPCAGHTATPRVSRAAARRRQLSSYRADAPPKAKSPRADRLLERQIDCQGSAP